MTALHRPTRTYHNDADSVYAFPNDSVEHVRLEKQFELIQTIMSGRTLHAPIDSLLPTPSGSSTARILDIGCGTGIGTDYLANIFPEALVYGLDLTPVPTNLREDRANLLYLHGNILTQKPSEWSLTRSGNKSERIQTSGDAVNVFSDQETDIFDYCFSRLLVVGITNWPALLATEMRLLKPGGLLELHEWDARLVGGSPEYKCLSDHWHWYQLLENYLAPKGIEFKLESTLEAYVRNAGFEDVKAYRYLIPYGAEGEVSKEMQTCGAWFLENVCQTYSEVVTKMCRDTGKDSDTQESLLDETLADVRGRHGKAHGWVIVVTARKPI